MADDNINLFALIEQRHQENKEEHRLFHERLSNMKDELLAEIKEMRKDQEYINRKMEARVAALEKWKWTLIGAAGVVIFFIMGGQQMIRTFLG
jgi:hypothetical protein